MIRRTSSLSRRLPLGGAAALVPAVVLAVVLAGCGSSGKSGGNTGDGGSASGAGTGGGSSSAGASPGQYTNPVYSENFPDPAVLQTGKTFVAYGTQNTSQAIPTLTSPDLVHWKPGPDALPALPAWATGDTWAPEVAKAGTGYVMFYVAHDSVSGRQCIGRATATAPIGPFKDATKTPFLCQPDLGGSIDPNIFRDMDGSLLLYWKNDGNCCGKPTKLFGQRLSPDGARLVGKQVTLLGADEPWQDGLVEAPEMVLHSGSYVLLYSASGYATSKYAVGYAACTSALGPCHDRSTSPWLSTTADAAGPGHCYVITLANGNTWLLFHAWPPDAIGAQSPGRQLWLEPVTWKGSVPVAHQPSGKPQPVPAVG